MPSENDPKQLEYESKVVEANALPLDPRLSDTVEMDAIPDFPMSPRPLIVPKMFRTTFSEGTAVWVSEKSPAKLSENEDSVSAFAINEERALLVIADGLGGHRGGRKASHSLVRGLKKMFADSAQKQHAQKDIIISGGLKIPVGNPVKLTDADFRSLILDQIETTNRRLLKQRTGAATTLALVEIEGNRARSYHVGDSPILIIGQRGQIKYETISHSPVGYAVEAGMLSEHEAIYHESRHLVSNVVGSKEMSVELGPWVQLTPRDTILLASDGLFDNLMTVEIVDRIRSGSLQSGVRDLARLALDRMCFPQLNLPSKPDDLTILAYRRNSPGRSDSSEES